MPVPNLIVVFDQNVVSFVLLKYAVSPVVKVIVFCRADTGIDVDKHIEPSNSSDVKSTEIAL